MATFTGTAGADSFIGADGVADVFNFAPASLAAADTLRGGNAPGVVDVLRFTASGIFTAEMFAGVRGIERILLADGGNLLTRPVDLEASAQDRTLEIRGGAGGDTILGGFSPDATLSLRFLTGSNSTDQVFGGAGADFVAVQGAGSLFADLRGGNDRLQTSLAFLDGTDVLMGGEGLDQLFFLDAGTITAAMLAEVSGFEEFILAGTTGTTLLLNNTVLANAGLLLTITGGEEAALVDASAVNPGRILFRAASGADTLIGGGGNDTIESNGAAQGNLGGGRDTLRMLGPTAAEGAMDGGTGFDTIEIQKGGLHALGAYTNFERVTLALGASVVMSGTTGQELWGSDFNDAVTLGGAEQTVLADLGNDIVTVDFANSAGAVLDGGGQTTRDTLVLRGSGSWNLRSDMLVTGFERIIAEASTASSTIRLGNQAAELRMGAEALVIMGINAAQQVTGSVEGDRIQLGGAGQVALGGAGNDTIAASIAQLLGGAMVAGGAGTDRLELSGGGTIDLAEVTATGFETLSLLAATTLTTFTRPLAITGSAGADTITANAAGTTVDAGAGDDVLRTTRAGTTLRGGEGSDTFVYAVGDEAAWTGTPLSISGGTAPNQLDTLLVNLGGIGATVLDLTRHDIVGIDKVVLAGTSTGASLLLTIGNALVGTADGNNGGAAGDFLVEALGSLNERITVDASSLAGNNSLRFNPLDTPFFGGADSVTGGDSADLIRSAGGNDTLRGGGGGDVLAGGDGLDNVDGQDGDDIITGGNGADSLVAGAGLDDVTGGLGGDIIILTEGVAAADRVRFTDNDDGSLDINTSVADTSADRIFGFNPANDIIVLNRAGLGLGNGGVVSVAANGAWNIGVSAVFIFESNSANADTLESNNFGLLAEVTFAVNTDNTMGSGSSAGRTVALLISNSEASAVRRTGLYVWSDTLGDNLLDAGDVVQLLGILDGVTANQLNSANVLIG